MKITLNQINSKRRKKKEKNNKIIDGLPVAKQGRGKVTKPPLYHCEVAVA